MPYKDPEAQRAYYKQRYDNEPGYKETVKERTRLSEPLRREAIRVRIEEFRHQGCFFCDESFPACLAAHHLDPTTKGFSISDATKYGYSIKRLEAELAKCVCLCHSCHAKLHAGALTLPETSSGP